MPWPFTTSAATTIQGRSSHLWRHMKAKGAGCPPKSDTQGNLQKWSTGNSPWTGQTTRELLSPMVSNRSDCQRVEARETKTEKSTWHHHFRPALEKSIANNCLGKAIWNPFHIPQPPNLSCNKIWYHRVLACQPSSPSPAVWVTVSGPQLPHL